MERAYSYASANVDFGVTIYETPSNKALDLRALVSGRTIGTAVVTRNDKHIEVIDTSNRSRWWEFNHRIVLDPDYIVIARPQSI